MTKTIYAGREIRQEACIDGCGSCERNMMVTNNDANDDNDVVVLLQLPMHNKLELKNVDEGRLPEKKSRS